MSVNRFLFVWLFADQARNVGHTVQICKISIWVWKLLWCRRVLVLLSCACELYIINIPHLSSFCTHNYANMESCQASDILSLHRFLEMMIEIRWMLFGENLDLKSLCRTGKLHWKISTDSRMSLRVMWVSSVFVTILVLNINNKHLQIYQGSIHQVWDAFAGNMVVAFIILDWLFILMNTTTTIPSKHVS